MAEIVGVAMLSHSPFWDLSMDIAGPGATFVAGVRRIHETVAALAPDAVVVFGPDHFRNFFYDVMPPFCIGTETVRGFGDYGMPRGTLPLAADLAGAIHAGVSDDGFDPALSLDMGVDHGITQPYAALLPSGEVPMVPIMINANAGPRPSLRRCLAFGAAVGRAIRNEASTRRVLVVGSGGLSHWPRSMSADDPSTSPELRDYAITGRNRAAANSAARDAGVVARKGKTSGRVNPEWDRWLLEILASGDLEPILRLTLQEIERDGGNGAHEVRTWLAALGAWGGAIDTTVYEPMPEWVSGMGCAAAFTTSTDTRPTSVERNQ
jgi:2,3-dihydroxyphenylpropionate 1,2-dioxygenase